MAKKKVTKTGADASGVLINLTGTLHLSSRSEDAVRQLIRLLRPSTVFVEVCPERIPMVTATIDRLEMILASDAMKDVDNDVFVKPSAQKSAF